MSWFEYDYSGKKQKRSHRKDVWLRVSSLTDEVLGAIKKSRCKRWGEAICWVIVKELRPDQMVLLEVWCQAPSDMLRKKWRYNVFHVLVKEDPTWTCEGDLGRGYVG